MDENEQSTNTLALRELTDLGYRTPYEELRSFFLCHKKIKHDLNAIKLAFDFIRECADGYLAWDQAQVTASRKVLLAIEELNARFKQHGIGYEFSDNSFVRIDSQFVHGEIVKPSLNLLTYPDYSVAQEEFADAHGYHLEGNATAALNECNKSLESVLKVICAKRKWQHNPSDGFGKLLEKAIIRRSYSQALEYAFPALTNLLAGVPKARNELSGHGRGNQEAVSTPPHVVRMPHI